VRRRPPRMRVWPTPPLSTAGAAGGGAGRAPPAPPSAAGARALAGGGPAPAPLACSRAGRFCCRGQRRGAPFCARASCPATPVPAAPWPPTGIVSSARSVRASPGTSISRRASTTPPRASRPPGGTKAPVPSTCLGASAREGGGAGASGGPRAGGRGGVGGAAGSARERAGAIAGAQTGAGLQRRHQATCHTHQ
jgi:hypothetical protein